MSYTISGLAEDLQRQAEAEVKKQVQTQGEKLAQEAVAKAASAAGALARDPRARTTPAAASAADKARAIAIAKAKALAEMRAAALTAKAVADAKNNVFAPPDDPVTGPVYTTVWKRQRLISGSGIQAGGRGPIILAPGARAVAPPVTTAPPAADLPPVFVDESGNKTDDTGKPAGLSPVVIVGGLAVLGGLYLALRK